MTYITEFLRSDLALRIGLIILIVALMPLVAGYVVLLERKILADMQVRLGPMRVGPHGLLQPIADAVKLLIKEDIIPEGADRWVFWFAPAISVTTALSAFAFVPFSQRAYVVDVNVGILLLLAVSSVGILGIILGGWSSNSHYPLLGALRSAAQLVSYEVAMGMAILSGLLLAGTLSMREIVRVQQEQHIWFFAYSPFAFFIYLVACVAETNRAPFDLPEAESELVAGFHTEYSGFRWALYFLAEYSNMIVVSCIAVTLFLGGWLAPFPNVSWLKFLQAVPPELWFLIKVFIILYSFIWYRGTFPRYRFDQLMRLGWRFMIPLGIVNVIGVGTAIVLAQQYGWGLSRALWICNAAVFLVAAYLAAVGHRRERVIA
jgi:NADH-quinone oxidoreductase subunit H